MNAHPQYCTLASAAHARTLAHVPADPDEISCSVAVHGLAAARAGGQVDGLAGERGT